MLLNHWSCPGLTHSALLHCTNHFTIVFHLNLIPGFRDDHTQRRKWPKKRIKNNNESFPPITDDHRLQIISVYYYWVLRVNSVTFQMRESINCQIQHLFQGLFDGSAAGPMSVLLQEPCPGRRTSHHVLSSRWEESIKMNCPFNELSSGPARQSWLLLIFPASYSDHTVALLSRLINRKQHTERSITSVPAGVLTWKNDLLFSTGIRSPLGANRDTFVRWVYSNQRTSRTSWWFLKTESGMIEHNFWYLHRLLPSKAPPPLLLFFSFQIQCEK